MSHSAEAESALLRRQELARLFRLRNSIQHYAWGSRRAIAELEGRPHPSEEPEAELWVGAHSNAPSRVELGDREIALDRLLTLRPVELLGAPAVRRHGPSLPVLLKVLAADRPLSIQVHPDRDQALLGFQSDNAAGLGMDAAERRYHDPNPKRELVYALSDFPVLRGFRPLDQARELLAALELVELDPLLAGLAEAPLARARRRLLEALLDGDPQQREALAAAVVERVAKLDSEPFQWVAKLARSYPGDPTILAPLVMELIELRPGEALFTDTGTLHSYLGGTAVELMTNSDNVLRAGLTSKLVDRGGLLDIVRFEEAPDGRLAAEELAAGRSRFLAPTGDLALERIDLRTAGTVLRGAPGLEIVLCIAGRLTARWSEGRLDLSAGNALLAPAILDAYELSGAGVLFRVSADPSTAAASPPPAS